MHVCVYAVQQGKAQRPVVKFIRFVFANMAASKPATPPLPLNYVQLKLDMNMERAATKFRYYSAKHTRHTSHMRGEITETHTVCGILLCLWASP